MEKRLIRNNSKGISAFDLAKIRDNPDVLKLFGIKVEGYEEDQNGDVTDEESKKLSRDKTRKSTISSPEPSTKLGKKKSTSGKKKKKRVSEPPVTQEGKMLEEV